MWDIFSVWTVKWKQFTLWIDKKKTLVQNALKGTNYEGHNKKPKEDNDWSIIVMLHIVA